MASGLTIQWSKSEAKWLFAIPRPSETDALQWLRKDVDSPGQLLGCSFIDGLWDDIMFQSLIQKLKEKLQRWNRYHVSLHGKTVIVNHVVTSSLWYILIVVATNPHKLHKLQQMLVSFIWGKEGRRAQHKVPEHVLMLPKHRSGLGLIDVTLQVKALYLL